ncbi:18283_t:CDS:2 [Gigaspora margarita]|uniref:18283_t:CDS:1 n=1 Tax=Gigaspora margarita TaxID=4874 RepID=A0ABN7VXD6_GIGMA|nr:18283_t:CDS:2 [Gigaspora margarita]
MLNIILEIPDLLILDFHYNQQTKVFLNGYDFILTVQMGTKNKILLPEYHCKSEQFETTEIIQQMQF